LADLLLAKSHGSMKNYETRKSLAKVKNETDESHPINFLKS
jgi:hypothetical protein